MLDKQLDLHTHLSKVCIYAVPARHTLMRQLFRQQARESVGGDAAEFVAAGRTRSAGPQRGCGGTGGGGGSVSAQFNEGKIPFTFAAK